eukprot:1156951-Pelagomonas_calceolata.AAC.10
MPVRITACGHPGQEHQGNPPAKRAARLKGSAGGASACGGFGAAAGGRGSGAGGARAISAGLGPAGLGAAGLRAGGLGCRGKSKVVASRWKRCRMSGRCCYGVW